MDRRKEFEETALQYKDELYKSALRMTRNEIEAEDLVQETFLRAYRFFNKFEKGTSMKAWLLKILKNTFINKFNEQSKMPEYIDFEQLKFYEEEPIDPNDPEEDIIYRLFDDEVMKSVHALPGEFRDVIILSDVQGFSYKEVSEILGCPIGTVMSRLHRGRKLLRKSLYEYAKELGYAYNI